MPLELRGQWVLVTGASSGLGRAMACDLVTRHGARVLAVARRADALLALSAELGSDNIVVKPCDLTDIQAVEEMVTQLEAFEIKAAILNAGQTLTGSFGAQAWASQQQLLQLNIISTTYLARAFLGPLTSSKGAMMLIASLAGEVPMAYQAIYGASKAYVLNLGLALQREVGRAGPSVTVCAPGGIATPMTAGDAFKAQRHHMMPAQSVAEKAVEGMLAGKTLVIPGGQNKLMAAAIKSLPRAWVTALLERQFRQDMS